MSDTFSVIQDEPLQIVVTLKDVAGTTITTYLGTEGLTTTIWPGGNLTPSINPTTTWVSTAAGTIKIAITGAQTATLVAGTFQILTELDDGTGDPVACYTGATLTVLPGPSGLGTRTAPTIVTTSEAIAAVPGLSGLTSADVGMLVQDASGAVEDYCRRKLALRTHDERRPISRERVVRLKEYPVVTVGRVCTGLTVGLTVANSTLTRPTTKLTPSTDASDPAATPVSLKLNGYASGVAASTVTLSFATYPTLTTLAAAINSAGSGWSATLGSTDYASLNSVDLNPDWGTKGASSTDSQYAGAPLLIYAHDVNRYDVYEEAGYLTVHDWIAPFACPVAGWYGGYGGFGNYRKNPVRVIYSAGYNADPSAGTVTMPAAIRRAAFVLIQIMYQQTAVGMKLSEKTQLVSMQYGYAKDNFTRNVNSLLDPFVRKGIH